MALGGATWVISLELVVELDVQISPVPLVGPAVELDAHLLAGLDGDGILEVEDGLLPVCVLCVWASRELDGLVAGAELDVEPGDQSVDVVGTADSELEGGVEGQVGDGDGVKVDFEDCGWVGDNGLHLDSVDEGLGESGGLEGRVVEAPDVVPDCPGVSVCGKKRKRGTGMSSYSQSSPPYSRRPRYQQRRWWPCRGRSDHP